MYSILETEEEGVTIIHRVERFVSEPEFRYLQYCAIRFQFPSPLESSWIVEYNLSNDNSRHFYAYLSRQKDNTKGFIELSGTFSVLTSDGESHILGAFLNHEFPMNTVKEIKLKGLNSVPYEKEELFPNDILSLRCHFWSSSVEERTSVTYYSLTRCLVEKCFFPWIITGDVNKDDDGFYFGNHVKEIPMDFTFYKKPYHLELVLVLEDILSPQFGIRKVQMDFDPYICHKVSIKSLEGELLCFSENSTYLHMIHDKVGFRTNNDINFREFIFRRNLSERGRDPDCALCFICEFKCIRERSVVLESVKFESDLTRTKGAENGDEAIQPKVGITLIEEDRTLRDALYTLYQEGKLCDVTLQAENGTYPTHKAVLCARSSVFSAMFNSDMKEKEESVVEILGVNSQTLSACLNYLYTDKIGILDWEQALKLFVIADRYAILPLKKRCILILKCKMTAKNACEALALADVHNDQDLRKCAENYICKHAKDVIISEEWELFKKCNPLLALNTMDQLAKKVLEQI